MWWEGTYEFIPTVTTCCFCIGDLQYATILAASFGILDGAVTAWNLFASPACVGFVLSALGGLLYWVNKIMGALGVTMLLVSILLLYTTRQRVKMEGPLEIFPWKVDNCFFCVKDLKIATIIISVLGVMTGGMVGSHNFSTGICPLFRSTLAGELAYYADLVYGVFALGLVIGAIVMLVTTIMNKPIVKPYIICWLVMIAAALLSILLTFVRYYNIPEPFRCYRTYYGYGHSGGIFGPLVSVIIEACIGLYFCAVVNSFAAGG